MRFNVIKNIPSAWAAATNTWGKLGEPCPIGPLLRRHEHKVNLQATGWHAGPQHLLADQIAQGYFNNSGKDIYFAPGREMNIAAHFGARDHNCDAIILLIGGDAPVARNEQFGTYYFPRENKQKIYILEAYEINKVWLNYANNPQNQPSYLNRLCQSCASGAQELKQQRKL